MNEHLKKLEDQCWTQIPCDFDMTADGLSTVRTVFDRQKFAQLIVCECMDLVSQCSGKVHPDDLNAMFAEHFGIDT